MVRLGKAEQAGLSLLLRCSSSFPKRVTHTYIEGRLLWLGFQLTRLTEVRLVIGINAALEIVAQGCPDLVARLGATGLF